MNSEPGGTSSVLVTPARHFCQPSSRMLGLFGRTAASMTTSEAFS